MQTGRRAATLAWSCFLSFGVGACSRESNRPAPQVAPATAPQATTGIPPIPPAPAPEGVDARATLLAAARAMLAAPNVRILGQLSVANPSSPTEQVMSQALTIDRVAPDREHAVGEVAGRRMEWTRIGPRKWMRMPDGNRWMEMPVGMPGMPGVGSSPDATAQWVSALESQGSSITRVADVNVGGRTVASYSVHVERIPEANPSPNQVSPRAPSAVQGHIEVADGRVVRSDLTVSGGHGSVHVVAQYDYSVPVTIEPPAPSEIVANPFAGKLPPHGLRLPGQPATPAAR